MQKRQVHPSLAKDIPKLPTPPPQSQDYPVPVFLRLLRWLVGWQHPDLQGVKNVAEEPRALRSRVG